MLSDRKKNTVTQIWMLHLINNIYADSRRTHHFKRQLTNVTCIEWIKWHTSKWNLIVQNVMTKFDNFSLTYLLAYLDWGVRMTHLPHSTPVDISTAKMPNTASGTIFFSVKKNTTKITARHLECRNGLYFCLESFRTKIKAPKIVKCNKLLVN